MGLSDFFTFRGNTVSNAELPEIFPLDFTQKDFVNIDLLSMFAKVLKDVIARTHDMPEDINRHLWDSCLRSESPEGLISMLARAMTEKADLFLVYDKSIKLLRKAKQEEIAKIKADYELQAKSDSGVFISFKNHIITDMLKVYSSLEFTTIAGLNKTMNLSKAVQVKIGDLRASVSMTDAESAVDQAKQIAKALREGRDVAMDSKDSISTTAPDLTPIKSSIEFLNQKRSYYLSMPKSWVTGELTGGLGDSGNGEAKAVDRGLKPFFYSIVKPVLDALFGTDVKYKEDDTTQVTAGIQALQTFELIEDERLITSKEKRTVIEKLFGLNNADSL